MTDESITFDSSFDRDGSVFQEKISNKKEEDIPIYIEDRQYDVAELSAAGDQANVETVIDDGLDKLGEINPKNATVELEIGVPIMTSLGNSEGEEILLEGEKILFKKNRMSFVWELREKSKLWPDKHFDILHELILNNLPRSNLVRCRTWLLSELRKKKKKKVYPGTDK